METTLPRTLADYLALEYPFDVIADPDGGYVIVFPDLPGCMTQAETLEEVGPMAAEARALRIETEYERGVPIPLPSYPEEHSGKFNVRLPRSLHRSLATAAKREGVSLNQYVVMLLSRGDTQFRVEERLDKLDRHVGIVEGILRDRGSSGAGIDPVQDAMMREDTLESIAPPASGLTPLPAAATRERGERGEMQRGGEAEGRRRPGPSRGD